MGASYHFLTVVTPKHIRDSGRISIRLLTRLCDCFEVACARAFLTLPYGRGSETHSTGKLGTRIRLLHARGWSENTGEPVGAIGAGEGAQPHITMSASTQTRKGAD